MDEDFSKVKRHCTNACEESKSDYKASEMDVKESE